MKMEIISRTTNEEEGGGYIDIEIATSSSSSATAPPQQQFEFRMSSPSQNKESKTSPADELFYKGKLLPLYLPPRLQMVQKLLFDPKNTNSKSSAFGHVLVGEEHVSFEENYGIPLNATTNSTRNNTPLDSCNISPTESCRVSSELNPDEYFFEWSKTETNTFIVGGGGDQGKKSSWAKKIKKSSLGQRLKASSAYLRSLFAKPACTDEAYRTTKAKCNVEQASESITQRIQDMKAINQRNWFMKSDNDDRFRKANSLMRSIERDMVEDREAFCGQRRSFSGAIQWHSATKCLSSCSSLSSSGSGFSSGSGSGSGSASSSFSFGSNNNGCYDLQLLKRSSSSSSEVESSIQGAIAHCKKSQQLCYPKKTANGVGIFSFQASGSIQDQLCSA